MENLSTLLESQELNDIFEEILPTLRRIIEEHITPECGEINQPGLNTILGKWIEEKMNIFIENERKEVPREIENPSIVETPIIPEDIINETEKMKQTNVTKHNLSIAEEIPKPKPRQKRKFDDRLYTGPSSKTTEIAPSSKTTEIAPSKKSKIEIDKNVQILQNAEKAEKAKKVAVNFAKQLLEIIDNSSENSKENTQDLETTEKSQEIILYTEGFGNGLDLGHLMEQDKFYDEQVATKKNIQRKATYDYYQMLVLSFDQKEKQIEYFMENNELLEITFDNTMDHETKRKKVKVL